MTDSAPLEKLRIADPDTYIWVKGRIDLMVPAPDAALLDLLAKETIWALSQETGFGRAFAEGLLELIAGADRQKVGIYIRRVREAAVTGPALARLMAVHLAPVLAADRAMLARFSDTVAIMRAKGTYTLSEPLAVLTELLTAADRPSAEAYLGLLACVFTQKITYNHSVRLVYLLPKAVRGFIPRRRKAQIVALARAADTDLQLVDPFLEGMHKGLALLAPDDLMRFMDQALARFRQSPKSGCAFLALSSKLGEAACAELQVAVPLSQIKGQLDRYLNARLGRAVGIKPLSTLPWDGIADAPWVCSDGRFIYLPDEIDHFAVQTENRALGKVLARLEAGFFENGSFDFDLERAADTYPEVAQRIAGYNPRPSPSSACDAERFFACFQRPALADDLFSIFELTRVARHMARSYPGLMRQARPVLHAEARSLRRTRRRSHPLMPLYERLALALVSDHAPDSSLSAWTIDMARRFDQSMTAHSSVEVCARLVCRAYETFTRIRSKATHAYKPLRPPFGRRLYWPLVRAAFAQPSALAVKIKTRLAEQGLQVYRSDVQNKLAEQPGRLSSDDIRALVITRGGPMAQPADVQVDWSRLDLQSLFKAAGIELLHEDDSNAPVFYYPEWDNQMQDYLHDHARVQETVVHAVDQGDFYRRTLNRFRGMVTRIRRAFEFLKPEGIAILRQWPDGDAFDYRALLDFAIDLRAGRIPSDRLYIKRLKQERDVSALLLVDLSRSTANETIGGQATVLQVAKEALVLFCEALQVVGDTYAIAGFSGTGRHSVDYFRIKDFEEALSAQVQGRICALQPQRSTRMGAAVRHATAQLAAVASRVRLMIVVSDGFPNDLGYKADYAIADTRRAIQEARARNVHVKAITVNIGSDPKLDDLYGRMHHHVIGDVRELPDKLLRLYGTLTRRL